MGFLTTVSATFAVTAGAAAYYMRRKISKDWIDLRKLDLPHCQGQTVVITGGNVGLGYETAAALCQRQAKRIVLLCRNTTSGQEAATKLMANCATKVDCFKLDLASLASVRACAAQLQDVPIDVLILNAGVWLPEHNKTQDGFEMHFGVNHLGHFLLTQLLVVKDRIVFVASSLLASGQLDMEKQDFVYDGRQPDPQAKPSRVPLGYSDSKLMNALTCREFSTRLTTGGTCYAVCPGFCRSSLGRNVNVAWYQRILMVPLFGLIHRTTVQGSYNIVYCVLQEKSKMKNGRLYRDGEEHLNDVVDAFAAATSKKLWALTESLINKIK